MSAYHCKLCGVRILKDKFVLSKHLSLRHRDWLAKHNFDHPVQGSIYLISGKNSGTCVVCGTDTGFNPKTQKYHRHCGSSACRKELSDRASRNNLRVRGVEHLMGDPNHIMKCMSGRKNAGTYTFEDGTVQEHHSSNELEFLKYLNEIHHWKGSDIITTGKDLPLFSYVLPDTPETVHTYFPDAYIISLNLIIEIKDTTNTGYRAEHVKSGREAAKANSVKQSHFDYLFVENNNFKKFDELVSRNRKIRPNI